MAETLRLYEVDINGTTTLMRLSDVDAAAYGDRAKPVDQAAAPTPEPAPDPEAGAKKREPQNKARQTDTK